MDCFKGRSGVFSFRIDLDYFIPSHVMSVLDVAEKYGVSMTWFINGKSSLRYGELIRRIAETQDVQNHGFVHTNFPGYQGSYDNIVRGASFLRQLGIQPVGFSAPHGAWHESLGRALRDAGCLYSSEFRQFRTVYPFFQVLAGKRTGVLQVPVHPVSEGDLFYRGYTVGEVIRYFRSIIDVSYRGRVPIFLYGHPNYGLGKYPQILTAILEETKGLDLHHTSLTDYARFWIRKKPRISGKDADFNSAFLAKRMNIPVYARNYCHYLALEARKRFTGIDNE